nr:hypothetical protein [Trichlorobacter lovleyi]
MNQPETETGKRFAIATLGCKVNQFETADMIEQMQAAGWQQVNGYRTQRRRVPASDPACPADQPPRQGCCHRLLRPGGTG